MKIKFFPLMKQLFRRFSNDEVSALGAQMTYYLILAFFPFLIFIMTVISYTSVTSGDILSSLKPILAHDTYQLIEDFINGFLAADNITFLSIGMIGTIWASSSGVKAIIRGLNKAYNITEDRPFWKVRGISILFTIALGIIILISFATLIFGKMIGEQLFKLLHFPDNFDAVWNVVQYIIPLTVMFIVFEVVYCQIPNRYLTYREVIPGSLVATFGWVIISIIFAFYVNNWGNYTKVYGSIGGIIILLIWLYISSIIILLGGEINATLSYLRNNNKNSKI